MRSVCLAGALSAIFGLATLIRFDGAISASIARAVAATLPIVIGFKLMAIVATRCLRGRSLDATFVEVVSLAEATTIAAVGLLAIWGLRPESARSLPASVILIDCAATFLCLAGYRTSARLIPERYALVLRRHRLKCVLVVGATEVAEAIIRSIQRQPHLGLRVVGIIDANPAVRGSYVAGVKVVESLHEVDRLASLQRVESVLVPSSPIFARESRELARACSELGLTVQYLPSFDALVSGQQTSQPRDVDPSELLYREPVKLEGESIDGLIRDGVVLVTGAAGSIGSEICRRVLTFGPRRLILLDHSENGLFYLERELRDLAASETELVTLLASITDIPRLRCAFDRHRPTVVFHAAAHKHVPMIEANPGEAVKNNVFGTRAVVDEAVRSGVHSFVLISTDKAVNPSSVMGACKRLAEMYVQSWNGSTATRLVAVRFGNVIGSTGSVVPVFKQQIRAGGPVTVTHPEMTRYFMTIREAAQLVLQAGAIGKGGEIFVLEMGKPVKIADLARNLIRLSGLAVGREIEIVYTGIRPGEKLHEELSDSDEESLTTTHPKIFHLKQNPCSRSELLPHLDHLFGTVNGPAESVVRVLAELVPGYRPVGRERAVLETVAAS